MIVHFWPAVFFNTLININTNFEIMIMCAVNLNSEV